MPQTSPLSLIHFWKTATDLRKPRLTTGTAVLIFLFCELLPVQRAYYAEARFLRVSFRWITYELTCPVQIGVVPTCVTSCHAHHGQCP